MMEKYIISKLIKKYFLKQIIIHFVNVETDPKVWYVTCKNPNAISKCCCARTRINSV
jgi:hypothetical protein